MTAASETLDLAAAQRRGFASPRLVAVFFGFFLVGCAGLVPVVWQAHRDYRVANHYVETEAEILEVIPITSGYRFWPGKKRPRTIRPSFVFRFQMQDGQTNTTRGYDAYGGRCPLR
jgi:hypothetical protein